MKIKPDVILSFGGFVAFPIIVIGYFLKIPIIIHEQTHASGVTNKYSSFFAKKIAIARSQSFNFFPMEKTVLVGNPVSRRMFSVRPKRHIGTSPCLFITGGSRGSQTINSLIERILPRLIKKYNILHHTGYLDFPKFLKLKEDLSETLKKRYEVFGNIDPLKIQETYYKSDIIVARSGANTVSEIMAIKRPAILIPLAISQGGEQEKNALFAKKFGVAEVLDEKGLTPEKLFENIENVRKNWNVIVARVKNKKSDGENFVHLGRAHDRFAF